MNCGTNKTILIDAHFDLLLDLVIQRSKGRTQVIEQDYLDDFKKGGFSIITLAIFIENMYLPEMALKKALEQISALYAEIEESSGKIMLCKSSSDVIYAIENEKMGVILSLEGVEPIFNDLNLLRVFYQLGVRGIGITWSRRNFAADGCNFGSIPGHQKGGLTDFGHALVTEAEKLGMFIDVTHLNDEGFEDVIKCSKKPIIASHSNCRTLTNMQRNLTDEQIKAIAFNGGMICVNACNIIVADDDENSNVEYLGNHIDHIVNLVGINYVGFGFDFCDRFMKYNSIDDLKELPRTPFDVVKGHGNVGELLNILSNRGYSSNDLEKIGYQNYLSMLRNTLKV